MSFRDRSPARWCLLWLRCKSVPSYLDQLLLISLAILSTSCSFTYFFRNTLNSCISSSFVMGLCWLDFANDSELRTPLSLRQVLLVSSDCLEGVCFCDLSVWAFSLNRLSCMLVLSYFTSTISIQDGLYSIWGGLSKEVCVLLFFICLCDLGLLLLDVLELLLLFLLLEVFLFVRLSSFPSLLIFWDLHAWDRRSMSSCMGFTCSG